MIEFQFITKWIFLISFVLVFLFLYKFVKSRVRGNLSPQMTYAISLIFVVSTIIIALLYRKEFISFLAFGLAGLVYWIVYFGYTPKWSPSFITTFFFIFLPVSLANFISIQDSIPIFSLNQYDLSGLHILSIPLELFYLEFLLSYVGVIIFETIKQKST